MDQVEGKHYDFCLVLSNKSSPDQLDDEVRGILDQLTLDGLDFKVNIGINPVDLYVLIDIPIQTLRKVADDEEFVMLLDEDHLRHHFGEPNITAATESDLQEEFELDSDPGFEEYEEDQLRKFARIAYSLPAWLCCFSYWFETEEHAQNRIKQRDNKLRTISHHPEVVRFKPYELIYMKFTREIPELFYWRDKKHRHPFSHMLRAKLLMRILKMSNMSKMCKLVDQKVCDALFPLHEHDKIEAIQRVWRTYPFTHSFVDEMKEYFAAGHKDKSFFSAVDLMKDYFGEKIGLYFVFLGHIIHFLMFPSLLGIFIFVLEYFIDASYPDYSETVSSLSSCLFSFFVALWCTSMIEFWKRLEKSTAHRWGMIGFEQTEKERPEFFGDTIESYIDDRDMKYYPTYKRRCRLLASITTTVLSLALVISFVAGIYVLRDKLTPSLGLHWAQTLASLINSCQITITGIMYATFSADLTHRENHRTDTEYEDSLIVKRFCFDFVNSYASFFYIAFVAKYRGECTSEQCMFLLKYNLAIIFGCLTVLQLATPLIQYWTHEAEHLAKATAYYMEKRMMSEEVQSIAMLAEQFSAHDQAEISLYESGAAAFMSEPEKQFLRQEYATMRESIDSYCMQIIKLGYMTLFVSALPIGAVLAYFSVICDSHIRAWQLFRLYQRPFPSSVEDIGTWLDILKFMAVATVVTNASIAVFTNDFLEHYSLETRFAVYTLFQWICFTLQWVLDAVIPDVPEEVEIQMMRTSYLAHKVERMDHPKPPATPRNPRDIPPKSELFTIHRFADGAAVKSVGSSGGGGGSDDDRLTDRIRASPSAASERRSRASRTGGDQHLRLQQASVGSHDFAAQSIASATAGSNTRTTDYSSIELSSSISHNSTARHQTNAMAGAAAGAAAGPAECANGADGADGTKGVKGVSWWPSGGEKTAGGESQLLLQRPT